MKRFVKELDRNTVGLQSGSEGVEMVWTHEYN